MASTLTHGPSPTSPSRIAAAAAPPAPSLDFRSDTITQPSNEMRAAIAAAPVGDDDYCDDPSVIQLQHLARSLTHHEAALFFVSATMANIAAAAAWLHIARRRHPDTIVPEVICDRTSHIFAREYGQLSVINRAHVAGVAAADQKYLRAHEIEQALHLVSRVFTPAENRRSHHIHFHRMICISRCQSSCALKSP
eukprot:TRINITY_DN5440_c0_g1_i2.p3 TRINITY_DN5440_c0_g1~~TRINITY_DN5440_c0_g1_i2.p3  ORF type:complete len:194 (-),score=35.80 TRINITY_DN5440_c0_g1_i2:603-1184(-)